MGGMRAMGSADGGGSTVEIGLGAAQGAVVIDGPGQLAAQIGIVERLEAIGKHAGLGQGGDPAFPILAAHDLDGSGSLFLGGGLDGDLGDFARGGIERLGGDLGAIGLDGRAIGDAVGRVGADWGGDRIDHEIDLAEIGLDGRDGFGLDRIGKGIALDGDGRAAGGAGAVFEGTVIVPAGAGGLAFGGGALEGDTDRIGLAAKGGDDARGQAIAGRAAQHEDALAGRGDGALDHDMVDLALHIGGATRGMGGGADEAADLGLDDHGSDSSILPKAIAGMRAQG